MVHFYDICQVGREIKRNSALKKNVKRRYQANARETKEIKLLHMVVQMVTVNTSAMLGFRILGCERN